MERHHTLSDKIFETKFADCSLPPSFFTHEAHLRLAWIHLRQYGLAQAISTLRTQIQRYALHYGAKQKYHETITVASVKIMHQFMQDSQAETFADCMAAHPALQQDFMGLLQQHYSIDLLKDANARTTYIEADLRPFD